MTPNIFRTARPSRTRPGLVRPSRSSPSAILAASLGMTTLGLTALSASSVAVADATTAAATEASSHSGKMAVSITGWPNITGLTVLADGIAVTASNGVYTVATHSRLTFLAESVELTTLEAKPSITLFDLLPEQHEEHEEHEHRSCGSSTELAKLLSLLLSLDSDANPGNGISIPAMTSTQRPVQLAGLSETSLLSLELQAQTALNGAEDAFVTKLSGDGSGLVYSTYLGGSGNDAGFGIAVGPNGYAYVTGFSQSADFPTTAGAIQTASGTGKEPFVAALNGSGAQLAYSTYLGGSNGDGGYAIAVDSSNNAYVTGYTNSVEFPVTTNAYRTELTTGASQDAFIAKISLASSPAH